MKRIGLLMMSVVASMVMMAQEVSSSLSEYIPFVEDMKQWHVVTSRFGEGYRLGQYILVNEEEKAGQRYMKMYWTEEDVDGVWIYLNMQQKEAMPEGVTEVALVREEDRKVWIWDDERQREELVFDYALKAGERYETWSREDGKMVTYRVVAVGDCEAGPKIEIRKEAGDSTIAEGRCLRQWTVCRTDDESIRKTWIEGVGSIEGPLANLDDTRAVSTGSYLAYVESAGYGYTDMKYLPFQMYEEMNGEVHGSDLTVVANYLPGEMNTQLTYELEGERLHVYGRVVLESEFNNYAYFYEEMTDDPKLKKLRFEIKKVQDYTRLVRSLCAVDFYVAGFNPGMNYVVVDSEGEEHPVVNKAPQMAYRPMIEEGKVWKVGSTEITDDMVKLVENYYFEGDTIIDGRNCKKMMCQTYVREDYPDYDVVMKNPLLRYVGAWYEEDRKVYQYDVRPQQLRLMYDFSAAENDTVNISNEPFIIGPRQMGGLRGYKGVYRNVFPCIEDYQARSDVWFNRWLEGVGGIDGPTVNVYQGKENQATFLMKCTVGDEVIYLNDIYEDGATPEEVNAPKSRFDFTHTTKTRPKAPLMRAAEQPVYGEYNERQLAINLDPIDDAYIVRINDATGKAVYEKAVDAGSVVALSIDISAYERGRYMVTIENSAEMFSGEFETMATGIAEVTMKERVAKEGIYNMQGQRIRTLQRGLNIVNGRKVMGR